MKCSISSKPAPQGEVNDRDLRVFQRLVRERVRLGERTGLRDHLEVRLPLEHEGGGLADGGVILDERDPGQALLYGNRPIL